MPKRALTALFIDRISPPKTGRVEYFDRRVPALSLRVSASGAKSWCVFYRVKGKDKHVRRQTLGSLTKIPEVEDARRRASAWLEKARAGIDPVEERRTAEARAAANSVASAVEDYLAHCERNLRPATVRGYRQLFNHDVLPRWANRPISEISKRDVLELVNDKAGGRERARKSLAVGAGVQANRLLTRSRTFFGWCVANNLVTADPTAGVRKPTREATRERVLTDDEVRALWAATDGLTAERKDGVPWGALVRLLLLTAQRKSEVGGMRWSEIDLDKREWIIPGARTKNGKSHVVHLSAQAIDVLDTVARLPGRDLVFSGNGTTPASGFSRAKRQLDTAMIVTHGTSAADWTYHDLRRTAATGMARLGIAPHVADRVLNHTQGTIRGVAAVYNRFQYVDDRRNALDAWGGFVARLVDSSGAGNVVPIAAARS